MKNHALKEKLGFSGIITMTNYAIECERAHELDAILQTANQEIDGVVANPMTKERYQEIFSEFKSLCKVSQTKTFHNMVVLAGRKVFAQRLAGTLTYSGTINYGALGTDATAVADGDTVLGTEVKRKQVATIVNTDDQVVLDFYFSKADTNGTYEEFGCVIDGTSSVDTGQLYNHALTGGWVKTSLEAMTVSIQFNFNDA